MRNRFSKVIVAADHEQLLVGEDAFEEGLARRQFAFELAPWVKIGIDVAPQDFLCMTERLNNVSEFGLADDHKVEITAGPFVPTGHRTVDKSGVNLVGKRRQRLPQHIDDAYGLLERIAQVLIDRTASIGLEMDLIPDRFPDEHARIGKTIQLAQESPGRLAGRARDLAQVQ